MVSKFDSLLDDLGTGKWNYIGIFLVGYWCAHIPSTTLGGPYLTPAINFTCRIPLDGSPIYKLNTNNETIMDSCYYYGNLENAENEDERVACTQWDFDNSTFLSTITSEFELVCDREYLRATFQSMYFFGALIASAVVGFLSDSYGRKSVMTVGMILYCIMGNSISWLPNIESILVARFLQGLMHPTSISVCYTLAMEKSETKTRSAVGILSFFPWILGYFSWALYGYLIREWRWLSFAVPLTMFGTFPILWFVDESPRWLILKGYHDRAFDVLQRAARWNNKTLPPEHQLREIMKEMELESRKEKKLPKEGTSNILSTMKSVSDEIIILFKTKRIRRITLSVYCIFFVSGMVYYGLSLSGGNLGSDPFVYMALSGAMEIPGSTVSLPMVNYMGRRLSNIVCFLITGASLLLVTVLPKGWMVTTLALIGKMTISAAYQIIYLHATELYPTQVRVRGLGTSAMVSKIGSIGVPYLIDALGSLYWWGPSVVCGGAAIIACLVSFLLPETLGKPLPDTVAVLERDSVFSNRKRPVSEKEKTTSSIQEEEKIPLPTK